MIETCGVWMHTINANLFGLYHKKMRHEFHLLDFYYQNRYYFLDILVATTEIFYGFIAIYVRSESVSIRIIIIISVCFIGYSAKALICVMRFIDGVKKLADFDN